MPTGVVPDAGHMTIGTGLDMAAKRCGSTLHDGVGGSAHVGGQGMALLIGRKRVLEDRLERDERHRCLRTRGRRRASGCFLQYHAHHPRDKRLVQRPLSEVHWSKRETVTMEDRDHSQMLRHDVAAWNAWRQENWFIRPALTGANLTGADLTEANLREANLALYQHSCHEVQSTAMHYQ